MLVDDRAPFLSDTLTIFVVAALAPAEPEPAPLSLPVEPLLLVQPVRAIAVAAASAVSAVIRVLRMGVINPLGDGD